DSWTLNTPLVSDKTKHTGYFNAELDPDGTIRHSPLLVRSGNSYFPSLASKAFLLASNSNYSPKLEYSPVTKSKELPDLPVTSNETGDAVFSIPVNPQGDLLINYAGPQKMFPHMSFADLLSDSPDAEIEQRIYD